MNRYIINGYNHATKKTWWAIVWAADYDHAIQLFTNELDGTTDCINVDKYNISLSEEYTTPNRVIACS